jgi:hypothetical protein
VPLDTAPVLLDEHAPGPAATGEAAMAGAGKATARPPSQARAIADAMAPLPPPSAAQPDWHRLLQVMLPTEGMLQCAVVDLASGALLCTAVRPNLAASGAAPGARPRMPTLEMLAQSMFSARQAHGAVAGDDESADEMLITAAGRQALLRRLPLPGQPPRAFLALLDRSQANLALLRFRLADAGRVLAG